MPLKVKRLVPRAPLKKELKKEETLPPKQGTLHVKSLSKEPLKKTSPKKKKNLKKKKRKSKNVVTSPILSEMKPNFTLKPSPKSPKETKDVPSSRTYQTNLELVVSTLNSHQDLVRVEGQMGIYLKERS